MQYGEPVCCSQKRYIAGGVLIVQRTVGFSALRVDYQAYSKRKFREGRLSDVFYLRASIDLYPFRNSWPIGVKFCVGDRHVMLNGSEFRENRCSESHV